MLKTSLSSLFMLLLAAQASFAQKNSQSFSEINLSSPESTYQSFYETMAAYSSAVKSSDENLADLKLNDALATFDVDQGSLDYSESGLEQSALYLKESLDRLLENPDSPEINNNRIAGTNFSFTKKEGNFFISKFTINRAEKDYKAVKSLPYKQKNNPGAFYKKSWLNNLLPGASTEKHFGMTKHQWIFTSLSLAASFLLYYLIVLLLTLADRIIFKPDSFYENFFKALVRPFALIFAAVFLKAAGQSLQLASTPNAIWTSLTGTMLSIGVFWILYGLIQPLQRSLTRATEKTESDLDDQLVPLLMKTAKVAVVILAVLTIVQELGINVFSLVAGLGVGGLAIALAAKDTAANFFGSLMILFDQPFKKGEWVKIGDMEGTVEDIGFRSTRIRTFYDSQIVVPNSTVASTEIDNLGRRKYRRTVETLGLTYSTTKDQLEAFVGGVKNILTEHPKTKTDKSYVSFKRFGDSSLEILLYFFLDVRGYEDELKVKEEIYTKIKVLAEDLKVDFAFPSQSVYIEKGGRGEPEVRP
jgi:MscS family membrane protein